MNTLKQGCTNGCHVLTVAMFLAVVTFLLYFPAVHFGFIHLDDSSYVTENSFVNQGITPKNILWAFVGYHSSNWHPLTWISHMLDCELFGPNSGAHHLTNVLLHTLNSVLLFFALRQMTGAVWRSFFVAALFAWHPLHVESVAWISERKDLLCAFFWIIAILAYTRYANRKHNGFFLLSLLSGVLAMMAKPMAVTLPFVLFLFDVWPLNRFDFILEDRPSVLRKLRLLIFEKLPLIIFAAFVCIQTIRAQSDGAIKSLDYLPFWPRITNAAIAYVSYLGITIWPVDLAIVYPHPHTLRMGLALICTAILLLVTWFVFIRKKNETYLATGWLWYLCTLVPVIGILQVGVQSMADRYTYLPLIGIFIMLSWGLNDFAGNVVWRKRAATFACCIVLTACFAIARVQLNYWKDSETLFTRTLAVTDKNWKAHLALSCAFIETNRFADAQKHLSTALAINPKEALIYNKMAYICEQQGSITEATQWYQQATQINPSYAAAFYFLGVLYHKQNNPKQALVNYQEALNIQPFFRQTKNKIAWIMSTDPDSEIRDGQKALELLGLSFLEQPDTYYLCTLSAAYAETGQFDKAVSTAKQALALAHEQEEIDSDLVQIILNCITHYQKHQPYRSETALSID